MRNEFSVAGHRPGGFDEAGLRQWAEELRAQLPAPRVSLGLVFMSPALFQHSREVLEVLRVHAQVPLLAGCSSTSLVSGDKECENGSGLALGLFHLPGSELKAVTFKQEQIEEANGPGYWHLETGIRPEDTHGWLVFADPYHMDCEGWLRQWDEAYAPLPIVGGLACGDDVSQTTQVYLDDKAYTEGGVAISVAGDAALGSMISQGCTPIGETWTITKAERNVIQEIANRPAYQVLVETYASLSKSEREKTRGNLFVGLVMNEYLEEFHRGDFLVRNLLGADPESGAIAIGAMPRAGQTLQFQIRDAITATEDIAALLQRTRAGLAGKTLYGGCLASCNGRGQGLFSRPDHDASKVQEAIGPMGLCGFFCNGEIGPVGGRNYLHGYTASLALFVKA